jgi:hypothetical protein
MITFAPAACAAAAIPEALNTAAPGRSTGLSADHLAGAGQHMRITSVATQGGVRRLIRPPCPANVRLHQHHVAPSSRTCPCPEADSPRPAQPPSGLLGGGRWLARRRLQPSHRARPSPAHRLRNRRAPSAIARFMNSARHLRLVM